MNECKTIHIVQLHFSQLDDNAGTEHIPCYLFWPVVPLLLIPGIRFAKTTRIAKTELSG